MSMPNTPGRPIAAISTPAERRAADQPDLEAQRVERAGRRQLVAVDEPRRQRVERRPQETAQRGGDRLDDEQHPHPRVTAAAR